MNQKRRKLEIPQLGASESEILDYRDQAFGRRELGARNTLRCRRLENAARNLLYLEGRQWIELDTNKLYQGSRGFHFRDSRALGPETPKPKFNWIAGAVNIEMAALGRGKLTSNVRPTNRDPRVQAAAKVANDILQHRLKDLSWADKRAQFTFLDIVCGMGILKSYWDESFESTGYFANPYASMCITCGFSDAGSEQEDQPGLCPNCAEQGLASELQPFDSMTPEQAAQPDSYGQPLGIQRPKGQTGLEVVSPFDFYPENSGIDQDWYSMRTWRQATPRSLDWVLARCPELADSLEPDEPRMLMANHPVLGEWDVLGRYDNQLDADLFANHVMLYEVYEDRCVKYPNGRLLWVAGDKVARDEELYRSVGPQQVKLVSYAGCNWEQKHREIWGKALVDDLISPQNVYNGLASLELESIARTGSPNIIVPRTQGTNDTSFFEPYDNVGKVIFYDTDPLNPQARPEVLGGITTPPMVSNTKDAARDAIFSIQGPASIERGEAPKNITTTSGLQFLDEQADKRRGYRLDAIVSAFERIWSHQLELLWTLRVDDDFYQAEAEDGTWELVQYNKQSIAGQTKVEIEHQTEVDKSLYQREAVREAMADGLYTGTGPSMGLTAMARSKMLEMRGLPTEVVEDKNNQIEIVKQRWVDFVDLGSLPVIDPSTDDYQIQYEGLRDYLTTQEGRQISKAMGWDSTLKLIAGWEQRLAQAEMLDQQARQLYGTDNPQQAIPMFQQMQLQFQQQAQQYQLQEQQAHKLAAEGQQVALPPPPQAPVPPVFLPGDKADHIYGIWSQMILEKGGVPEVQPVKGQAGVADPMETLQKQDNYLRFRAVVDAYRLLAQAQMVAAPGPTAGLPAQQGPAGGATGAAQLNIQAK